MEGGAGAVMGGAGAVMGGARAVMGRAGAVVLLSSNSLAKMLSRLPPKHVS